LIFYGNCNGANLMSQDRDLIKAVGIGATTAALTAFSGDRSAQSQNQSKSNQTSQMITKLIPRTQERVPAIGMGTFMTFDAPEQQRRQLQEVMQRFRDAGGGVIDVSPLYGLSEVMVGDIARAIGITKDLFIANKIWATGEFLGDRSQAQRQLEQSLKRLSRDRLDVMQVHSLVNVEMIVPLLREWKQEGRIRYLGVTHHDLPLYAAPMAKWIENGNLDFVQVHYSIFERSVEERILPTAAEKGTAVLVNMPLEKARLFEVVQGKQLPDFAREFGCENWAQFFLKYTISHPAVTCAIPATSNPEHLTQNMGALKGELPDRKMRNRMVQYMESLPEFAKLAQMPWYPGKKFTGLVRLPSAAKKV
jgi:diketogulonate reductase-like aldo/keto reductase